MCKEQWTVVALKRHFIIIPQALTIGQEILQVFPQLLAHIVLLIGHGVELVTVAMHAPYDQTARLGLRLPGLVLRDLEGHLPGVPLRPWPGGKGREESRSRLRSYCSKSKAMVVTISIMCLAAFI